MPSNVQQVLAALGGGGGSGGGSEAAAFLARTSGLDATHTNAYIALIDGLVAAGIWSKLDFLYVPATQDSTTALLNLVSSTYNATAVGSPTFTADRGFTGVNNSSTVYISSNFNPSTAVSPKLVRDSAHISAWSITDIGTAGTGVIGYSISGNELAILPRYSDGNGYFRTNSNGTGGASVASSAGLFMGNRSSSTAVQAYRNDTQIMNHTSSDNSVAVQNANMAVLGININTVTQGSAHQIGAASAGSSMNSTEEGDFYTLPRAFLTTVGAP